MKFNISYPLTGAQKTIEVDDDKKCAVFFDRRMGQQVEADSLGDEYKGYVFKITGGNDKQGFPMRQGVLFKGRVRILMRKGHKGYRPRRSGEMKRKSIRGCIVGPDIRVLAVQLIKKGEKEIDGLTNVQVPQRLGPKRLTRIRKLFGFKKSDGVALVKKSVIRRTWEKNGKKHNKAAKIQRLVTESRLRRKVIAKKTKEARWAKSKSELEAYKKLAHDIHEAKKRHRKASSEIREKAKQETKPVVAQKQAPPQKQAVVPPQKQAVKQPVVAAQKPAPVTAKKGGK